MRAIHKFLVATLLLFLFFGGELVSADSSGATLEIRNVVIKEEEVGPIL